jgi:predicted RNA-binding protein with PUA-like domain
LLGWGRTAESCFALFDYFGDYPLNTSPRYWAFVCVPSFYRIYDALNETETDTWRVRNHKVKAGDRALIWKAKDKGKERGIIAFAEVLSNPQMKPSPHPQYYRKGNVGDNSEMRVDIRYVRLEKLPLWHDEDASSPLGQLSCSRGSQGSIFIVTPEQWQTVVERAGGWSDNASFAAQQYADTLVKQEMAIEDASGFNAHNIEDARKRTAASIVQRRGQSTFRQGLLQAYQGKCAVTECEVTEILEAAHIVPYQGTATNHMQNGILLRADLHTLFDMGLVGVDAETMKVLVSSKLDGSEYASFQGKLLHLPDDANCKPDVAALKLHRQKHGL